MAKNHVIIDARWVRHAPFLRGEYWCVKIRDLQTGKTHFVSTREKKENKAHQAIQRWIEERKRADAGALQLKGSARSFKRSFKEWLDLKTDLRPATITNYRIDLEKVYGPAFEGKLVGEIGFEDIERFLNRLAKKKKASRRTRAKHLGQLRSFFRWCVSRRYVKINPCEGIKLPRGEKREGVALTLDQARKLIEAAGEDPVLEIEDARRGKWEQTFPVPPYLQLACLLGLHTGLRRGNVLGLRWRHIDLGQGKIRFEGAEMKSHRPFEIPIHPELEEVLRRKLRGRRKVDPKRLVLGARILRFDNSFKAALERAGLPRTIRFHDLRHSFSSWLALRVPYALQKELMGHTPADVTLQYSHCAWPDKVQAIHSLPRLLTAPEEPQAQAKG